MPDQSVRGEAIAYANENELRLPIAAELMDTVALLAAVADHRWGQTVDKVEAMLMAMNRRDRNDAIEALRSRFDDIYYDREMD